MTNERDGKHILMDKTPDTIQTRKKRRPFKLTRGGNACEMWTIYLAIFR